MAVSAFLEAVSLSFLSRRLVMVEILAILFPLALPEQILKNSDSSFIPVTKSSTYETRAQTLKSIRPG